MDEELAPLRRAHELLTRGESVDDIVSEIRMLFGLTYVDALAAVAAVVLLAERGLPVPQARSAWYQPHHA